MPKHLEIHQLFVHVEQRIQERCNLGHLYMIEQSDDGPVACMTDEAAASIWRAVYGAIKEAGWRITPRDAG